MPRVRVVLPRSLLLYWKGPGKVDVEAGTVLEALDRLGERYPGLAERILDDQRKLREFVHVFVNRDAVPSDELGRALADGDTVHVMPSVAGGSDP